MPWPRIAGRPAKACQQISGRNPERTRELDESVDAGEADAALEHRLCSVRWREAMKPSSSWLTPTLPRMRTRFWPKVRAMSIEAGSLPLLSPVIRSSRTLKLTAALVGKTRSATRWIKPPAVRSRTARLDSVLLRELGRGDGQLADQLVERQSPPGRWTGPRGGPPLGRGRPGPPSWRASWSAPVGSSCMGASPPVPCPWLLEQRGGACWVPFGGERRWTEAPSQGPGRTSPPTSCCPRRCPNARFGLLGSLRNCRKPASQAGLRNAPDWIRTSDLRFRRPKVRRLPAPAAANS